MNLSSSPGIVYAVTNPAMPGFVKIGRTTNLSLRLRDLDNTNVPLPFKCVIAVEVPNARAVETLLHQAFADCRVRKTREFFEIDPEQVIAAVRLTQGTDVTPSEPVAEDAEGAVALQKRADLTFTRLQIPVGSELRFRDLADYDGEPLTAHVVGPTTVKFDGQELAITRLTGQLLHQYAGWKKPLYIHHGPYWYYGDERLDDRRARLGV